jgi:Flp pilus assembly protein TadG
MHWMRRIHSRLGMCRLSQDESGQSLVLVVFAIVAIFAIIGLGIDLGVVYVERVNLSRAMDAAALAGAQELPAEEAAHQRALEYLDGNDYDIVNACIETLGSGLGEGPCGSSAAETKITIDTFQFRDAGAANTANKIRVSATQAVPLAFMRVFGIKTVGISASATAENIEDLDIVIVYDRSGSMQEDTRCFGCWELDPVQGYRAGTTYQLNPEFMDHCADPVPLSYGSRWYVSIEAELYSRYLTEADYHKKYTEFPKIWWAMQRQPNVNASGTDTRGAFLQVGPHSGDAISYPTLADIVQPPHYWTTPRVDYDFTVPATGTYYVWMRAQGGGIGDATVRRQVHVGLNGTPMATGTTDLSGPYGPDGGAAYANRWRWTRVTSLGTLTKNDEPGDVPYTLNFWAAGAGFSLDKIVITNNSSTSLDSSPPLNWSSGRGPTETHGRTGWACMPEQDPRFAPVYPPSEDPDDLDDLYDDQQPIRAAKEAAKNFVRRLDPELDQIGYVWYSSSASIREELYCLKQLGSCADFQNVIDTIETTIAQGSTNIGDAMWDGLRVLTTGVEPAPRPDGKGFPPKVPGTMHYGRANAAHIMVLMTDGQANQSPTLPSSYGNCYSDNLWPDQPGETTDQRRARECVVWFGHQARDRGVVIYSIGLGAQADNELLAHVADITGGVYYYAPSGAELDEIFERLYENIFLRLTE